RGISVNSVSFHERIADPPEQSAADLRILNPAQFGPENPCQFPVVVTQLPQTSLGESVNVIRSPPFAADCFALDVSCRLEPGDSLAGGRCRACQRGAQLPHGAGLCAAQLPQKSVVGGVWGTIE